MAQRFFFKFQSTFTFAIRRSSKHRQETVPIPKIVLLILTSKLQTKLTNSVSRTAANNLCIHSISAITKRLKEFAPPDFFIRS